MKKHFSLLIALVASSSIAFGQWTSLPIYESFNYSEGNLGLSTATSAVPWNYGSTRSALVVAGPNLTYPGMTTTENKVIKLVNTGTAANIKTNFPVGTSPIYASFLLRGLTAPSASSTRIASFGGTTNSSGTFSPGLFYDQSGSGFRLGFDGMGKDISVSQSQEFALNTTIMVIMKYSPNIDANAATSDFWINPTSSSTETTPDITGLNGGLIKDVSFFTLKTGTGAADVLIDELHISTSWFDVAPKNSASINGTNEEKLSIKQGKTRNSFYINGGDHQMTVDVFSLDGKKHNSLIVTSYQQFEFNNLAKGIYVAKVSDSNTTSTTKINIQ